MKWITLVQLGSLALPTTLAEFYVYIYVPIESKDNVTLTGTRMTDGEMYQASVCYADSTLKEISEEECKDRPYYAPRDQIMFDQPGDVRILEIGMPQYHLSCNITATVEDNSVRWLVGWGTHNNLGAYSDLDIACYNHTKRL